MKDMIVHEATEPDGGYAEMISAEMEASAIIRGSGISKRSPASGSCVNYDILQRKEHKNCLCTAMLFDSKRSVTAIPEAARM